MYDQFIDLNLGIMTLEAMILQFPKHVIILAILVNLQIHDNKTSKPDTLCFTNAQLQIIPQQVLYSTLFRQACFIYDFEFFLQYILS
jgi:hypothetical protein